MAGKKRPVQRSKSGARHLSYSVGLVLTVLVIAVTAYTLGVFLPAVSASPAPTLEATLAPAATAAATSVPQPTDTPQPTATPTPEPTPEPSPVEYLPVYQRADSVEGYKIAITVDDCYQLANLQTISRLAQKYGGKLTLFPTGDAIDNAGIKKFIRKCVFELGYEIENHTYNHARIFRMEEKDMAAEIWRQKNAVCQALGVNYNQHFFRLMGGDGEYDQRTHNYLNQLGYLGVASWAVSGSDKPLDELKASLFSGGIYLFHPTEEDTKKLKEFIPYAVSKGYQLVTLNELLGLPENEISDLSTFETEMPEPRPYLTEYVEQKVGDYSWNILQMQKKLVEMGYLAEFSEKTPGKRSADGVYGPATAEAVKKFQQAFGLTVTGIADAQTQKLLLEDIS